ncbi:ATP-binding protein [Chitinilyticum litopenaei]|uniref:ATP-binding protein n=1 Tax=Chitinilyticum litopenaei TaxID=1121276 RepID=UPI000419909C|nr:ATP-binding protein [Chitinilyticum litopenaei]
MSTSALTSAEQQALAEIDAILHSDLERARQACVRLIEASRLQRSPLAHVLAAERYGLIMDHQGHAPAARDVLFEALQVAQAEHLFVKEAGLLEQIARGYYTSGEYRPAIQFWARAVELCEASADADRVWMLAKVGLGQVYDALGDHASAVALHRAALGRIGLAPDAWLEAKIRINLGVNLIHLGDLAEAGVEFEQALQLCNQGHFWDYAAEAHQRLGELAMQAGQPDQAEVHLYAGLATARMVAYRWGEANLLSDIAELQAQAGHLPQALATVLEGAQISEAFGFIHILERQHLAAARYAELLGGYSVALAQLKAGFQLAERIQAAAAPERQRELEDKAGLRPSPGRLLVELSNHPVIDRGNLARAFSEICRQSCAILAVARAQILLIDDSVSAVSTACLYLALEGRTGDGQMWSGKEWPQLADWLAEPEAIIAHDSAHHPLTWSLHARYLQAAGVSSLLAYPIRVPGRLAGLLWLEHVGTQRNWTPDELVHGSQLADIAARALATRERKVFQNEIHQLNVRLMEANQALEERVQSRTRELEQANADLRHAMQKLVQAEKLASLGSLVAGIAHELNTPLGGLLTMASTLQDESGAFMAAIQEGRARRTEAERFAALCRDGSALIRGNVERAAGLIARFRQVAVDTTSERRRAFDLAQLVEDVLATMGVALAHAGCRLERQIPPGLQFDSYPGPLEQVLTHLLSNTLQHGFAGRTEGQILISARPLPDERVELMYLDNGNGIPVHLQKRAFDPFFTTRMGQGGSGLGLYLVYNFVTGALGGDVRLESVPGQFTRFTLSLPRVAPGGTAAP